MSYLHATAKSYKRPPTLDPELSDQLVRPRLSAQSSGRGQRRENCVSSDSGVGLPNDRLEKSPLVARRDSLARKVVAEQRAFEPGLDGPASEDELPQRRRQLVQLTP